MGSFGQSQEPKEFLPVSTYFAGPFRRKAADILSSKAFKKLDPIDRFILIVVALRAMLLAAILEIEHELKTT